MCIMCLLTLFWTFEQGRGVIWFFLLGESSYSWKLLLPFLWEVVGIPIIQWNKEERWCFQAMETQVIITFVNLKKEKKTPQNFLVLFRIFKTWEYRTTSIYGSKQGRFFFFSWRETAWNSWDHQVLQREKTLESFTDKKVSYQETAWSSKEDKKECNTPKFTSPQSVENVEYEFPKTIEYLQYGQRY